MLGSNLLTLALLAPAVASASLPRDQPDLSAYIKTESNVSLHGVLNNIGSHGKEVKGASDGIVVASPSKANPDCERAIHPKINIAENNDR